MFSTCYQEIVLAWAKMNRDMFPQARKPPERTCDARTRDQSPLMASAPRCARGIPQEVRLLEMFFKSDCPASQKSDKAAASRGTVLHLHCPSARKPYAGD
jgi:hypothetical protein